MRWPNVLFIFFLITAILHVDGGLTTQRPSPNKNGPMFTSAEIARSRIRVNAQKQILQNSALNRGHPPYSPHSPLSPLSGGSGASSPPLGGNSSPPFGRPPITRKPLYLGPAPSTRFPAPTMATTPARKPSCASVCEPVFSLPGSLVCVFDRTTREFVPLRNTPHIACYKCLHPTHQVEVVPVHKCEGGQTRRRRWIGSS